MALIQLSRPTAALAAALRLVIAVLTAVEIGYTLVKAPWPLAWLRQNWAELLVVAAYLAYVVVIFARPEWYLHWGRLFPAVGLMVIRNLLAYFRIVYQLRRLSNFISSISLHPAQTLVLSFAAIIVIGALALMLPLATVNRHGLGLLDALFTATSAVCVTGLIVVDTATYLSLYGKIVVLVLIQIGGLGIMLLSYSASWVITRQLRYSEKLALAYMTNQDDLSQVAQTMQRIVGITFGIEAGGTLLLAISFLGEGFALGKALWYGLFHSVSAFCNAGFALFTDSFMQFQDSVPVNAVLSLLIILGGLSFPVIINLGTMLGLGNANEDRRSTLSLNSKVVLSATGILLLSSSVLIYFSEHGNSLADYPVGIQYLSAFFQAVTLRTAGFNTVDFAAFSNAALWVSVLFMVVGGASGSTAGGIKVNTIAVIFAYLRSRFRGRHRVLLFDFALTRNAASNALVLFTFAVFAVSAGFFLLLLTEDAELGDVLFETVSAFATVGVSRGLTASLSIPGRFIIILLMFMGRLGPLTLLTALADRQGESDVMYPEQEILIG